MYPAKTQNPRFATWSMASPTFAGFHNYTYQSLEGADSLAKGKILLSLWWRKAIDRDLSIDKCNTFHSCGWSLQHLHDTIAPADLPSSLSSVSFWWIAAFLLLLHKAYWEVASSIRRRRDMEDRLLMGGQAIQWGYPCFIFVNKHRDLQCLPSKVYLPMFTLWSRFRLFQFWLLQFEFPHHFWMLLFWLLSSLALLTLEFAEGPDIRAEMDAILDNPCSRMTWKYANPSRFSNSLGCVHVNIFHIRFPSSPSLGR